MDIWETKPPVTVWATPGLLRDCFTLTISKIAQHKCKHYVCMNPDSSVSLVTGCVLRVRIRGFSLLQSIQKIIFSVVTQASAKANHLHIPSVRVTCPWTWRPPLLSGITLYLIRVRGRVDPQGQCVEGRIMSMKNSNDPIGNRTRDLLVCSAVP